MCFSWAPSGALHGDCKEAFGETAGTAPKQKEMRGCWSSGPAQSALPGGSGVRAEGRQGGYGGLLGSPEQGQVGIWSQNLY